MDIIIAGSACTLIALIVWLLVIANMHLKRISVALMIIASPESDFDWSISRKTKGE